MVEQTIAEMHYAERIGKDPYDKESLSQSHVNTGIHCTDVRRDGIVWDID